MVNAGGEVQRIVAKDGLCLEREDGKVLIQFQIMERFCAFSLALLVLDGSLAPMRLLEL